MLSKIVITNVIYLSESNCLNKESSKEMALYCHGFAHRLRIELKLVERLILLIIIYRYVKPN